MLAPSGRLKPSFGCSTANLSRSEIASTWGCPERILGFAGTTCRVWRHGAWRADVRGILRSLNTTRFYAHVRDLPDGRFVGMIKVGFGRFRVIIADGRDAAVAAPAKWDPVTQSDPEGWFRNPPTGRRRPDGDPAKEFIRP